jgi:hypothetical protein
MDYIKKMGKMGVWGQRPQQAEACAEGEGSEHASDPCHRHGQKLVQMYNQSSMFIVYLIKLYNFSKLITFNEENKK